MSPLLRYATGVEVPLPYRAFGEAEFHHCFQPSFTGMRAPRLSQMHPQDDGTLLERA